MHLMRAAEATRWPRSCRRAETRPLLLLRRDGGALTYEVIMMTHVTRRDCSSRRLLRVPGGVAAGGPVWRCRPWTHASLTCGICPQRPLPPALFGVAVPFFPFAPSLPAPAPPGPAFSLHGGRCLAADPLPCSSSPVGVSRRRPSVSGNVRVGVLLPRPRGASRRPVLRPAQSPPSPPAGTGGPRGAASQGVSAPPRRWREVRDTATLCPRTASSLPWRSGHSCLLSRCGGCTQSRPHTHGRLEQSGGRTGPEHMARPCEATAGFHVPEEWRGRRPAFCKREEAPDGREPARWLPRKTSPFPSAGSAWCPPWGQEPGALLAVPRPRPLRLAASWAAGVLLPW